MDEPVYIAQTFEPKHVKDGWSANQWFLARGKEAKLKGGNFPRYSRSEDGTGLLIEVWAERPADQGDIRWMMNTVKETSDG